MNRKVIYNPTPPNKKTQKNDSNNDDVDEKKLIDDMWLLMPIGINEWTTVLPAKKENNIVTENNHVVKNEAYERYIENIKKYLPTYHTKFSDTYTGEYQLEWIPQMLDNERYIADKREILKNMKPLDNLQNVVKKTLTINESNNMYKKIQIDEEVNKVQPEMSNGQLYSKHYNDLKYYLNAIDNQMINKTFTNKDKSVFETIMKLYLSVIEKTPMNDEISVKMYMKRLVENKSISFRQALAIYHIKKIKKSNNLNYMDNLLRELCENNNALRLTLTNTINQVDSFLGSYIHIFTTLTNVFLSFVPDSVLQESNYSIYFSYVDFYILLRDIIEDHDEPIFYQKKFREYCKDFYKSPKSETITVKSQFYDNITIHIDFSPRYMGDHIFKKIMGVVDAFEIDENISETCRKNSLQLLNGFWYAPCQEVTYPHHKERDFGSLHWLLGYKGGFRIEGYDHYYKSQSCNYFSNQPTCIDIKSPIFNHLKSDTNKINILCLPVECSEYLSPLHIGNPSLRIYKPDSNRIIARIRDTFKLNENDVF